MGEKKIQVKLFFGDELDNNMNLFINRELLAADDIVSIKYAVCSMLDGGVMPTALLAYKTYVVV